MTTKIMTFRVPASVYSGLCANAAELGVSVSAHVRRLIEQEHHAEQVELLRTDLFERLDQLAKTPAPSPAPSPVSPALEEILLLSRATAAHLNPQLVAQVRIKLATPKQ